MTTAPPPAPSSHRPTTSLVGPVTLTASGALLCVATIVLAVLVGRSFAGLLPSDLLDDDGGPGSGVVVALDAPGTTTASLEADTRYVVLVAAPTPAGEGDLPELEADLGVTGPDGRAIDAGLGPGVNLTASRGATTVHSVGAFRTTEAGEHTLVAPATQDGGEARVLVALDEPFFPFFFGIFGTVAGVLAAVVTMLLGVPMLVVGIVWWRRRATARAAAQGVPAS